MASFSRRVILDIGASQIRLAEILPDRGGGPLLRQLRVKELEIDPTKIAEFFPAVLQAMESLVQSSGIKPGPTTLCLGGPSVFTRVIKVPQTDSTQVRQMVGYEAQQAIPAIEEACWDFQIFPSGHGGELEAMILAIKKESVEEMIVAAAKGGLQVDLVELAPTATINAFRYNYPEIQTSTLILDIGARATNILLVEGDKIFCRVVPLGGASITQAIGTDLQESFAGAETLKRAKGFVHPGGSYEDPSDETASRISKLSRGVVTRLHTEVERSITFYRSQQGGSRPAQMFLAGGCAGLGLLDFFFKEKLKIPVNYLQPFRRVVVEGGVPPDVQRSFPAWSCFVGAALRSLPDTPCRLNLMATLKNQNLSKQKDRSGIWATVVALSVLLILPGVHGIWQREKIHERISPQKTEVDDAELILTKLQGSQKRVSDRLATFDTAIRLEGERVRWSRLLEELARKSKSGMWITKLALQNESASMAEQASPAKAGAGQSKVQQVEISGIFETKSEEADAQVVEQFRSSLEESGILQKVVTVERETPERSADGKTEQVALKFALRGEWPNEAQVKLTAGGKEKSK
jgi:type IV pilus assembly protein PilM